MGPKTELRDERAVSAERYAGARRTTEGRVFTVTGGDWYDAVANPDDPVHDERIVVNLGPVHRSC